jgi:cAMP phosphodiesterase class-II
MAGVAKVLGCSESIGAHRATTAFLIDENVLIDAGTGVGEMELAAMVRVEHIFLSHSRLDRVASLPLFADTVLRHRSTEARTPVLIHALPATVRALQEHIFNGVIWPDFTRLPSREYPVIQLVPCSVGETLSLGDKHVEILGAVDALPAAGFAVHGKADDTWVYVCHAGTSPTLWARLREMKIDHLVVGREAFLRDSASASHSLGQELLRFTRALDVHVAEIRDSELTDLRAAVVTSGNRHRIHRLIAGDQMRFASK